MGLIMSSVTTALLNENDDEIREQVVLLKLLVEDLESLVMQAPQARRKLSIRN